jgi:hypothetical protein
LGHGTSRRDHSRKEGGLISWSEIWGSPRGAILVWIVHPGEGRAPHARKDGVGLAGACPHLATGRSFPPDDYVVPRHACGLAMGARRPRPSEKTASRVISGPSPQGLLSWANPPWRGGLRTPANETLLPPGDRSIRPPEGPLPLVIMLCLGPPPDLPPGRGDRVPCMYNTLAVG